MEMTKNKALISIIIPVYKVEEYLDECVKSIINQTYKNLEIILVDDGSPDRCPQMCDEWAKKDSRIRVIHKQNGGLSSARNAGLDIATGEYIGFVDSDDYIDHQMFEKLMNGFNYDGNIGVVSCSVKKDIDNVISDFMPKWNIVSPFVISANSLAKELLSCSHNFTVWSKLYDARILKGVRFQTGKLNEDSLFMFDLSKRIEKEGVSLLEIPYKGYYYRQRADSICSNTKRPLDLDTINNYHEMLDYYKACHNDEMSDVIEKYIILRCIRFVDMLAKTPSWKEYENEIKSHISDLKIKRAYSFYGIKMATKLIFIKVFPRLYSYYYHHRN